MLVVNNCFLVKSDYAFFLVKEKIVDYYLCSHIIRSKSQCIFKRLR